MDRISQKVRKRGPPVVIADGFMRAWGHLAVMLVAMRGGVISRRETEETGGFSHRKEEDSVLL